MKLWCETCGREVDMLFYCHEITGPRGRRCVWCWLRCFNLYPLDAQGIEDYCKANGIDPARVKR